MRAYGVIESLYGVQGELSLPWIKPLPALVTRNTRAARGGELPYRITWFNSSFEPVAHADIHREEAILLGKGKMPGRVGDILLGVAKALYAWSTGRDPVQAPDRQPTFRPDRQWGEESAARQVMMLVGLLLQERVEHAAGLAG